MPGILWPRIDDQVTGLKLAASGCIKDEVLPLTDVAQWLLKFLSTRYPQALQDRFGSTSVGLADVATQKGAVAKGGNLDLDKAADMLLRDFRAGRLGKISLDVEVR